MNKKEKIISETLGTLDALRKSREPEKFHLDFFFYFDALCRIEKRSWFGLDRPFTLSSHDGLFPIGWIIEFGHYTDEDINRAIGEVVDYGVFYNEPCIYRTLQEKVMAKRKDKVDENSLWKPISSAPKTGEMFIASRKLRVFELGTVAWYDRNSGEFVLQNPLGGEPTHWMKIIENKC